MKKYAVIQAWQDYDHIESLECIKTVNTKKEGNDFIKSERDRQDAEWKKRFDYIEKFVDDLDLRNMNGDKWDKYVNKFHYFDKNITSSYGRKMFKTRMKMNLRIQIVGIELEGYNPPDYSVGANNLFIVKLK